MPLTHLPNGLQTSQLITTGSPLYNATADTYFGGADPKGRTDSTSSIQAAIDAAEASTLLNSSVPGYTWITEVEGGIVFLPRGWYRIDSKITLPNSVALVGEGVRATGLVAGDSFSDTEMIDCVDSTNPIFNSYISNMRVHANNLAGITRVIHAQAWQERCGIFDSSIDGFQGVGLLIDDVSSGSAGFTIERSGFSGFSNVTSSIQVGSGVPNAFQLGLWQVSIGSSGLATNGILVENGHVNSTNLHFENCTNGVHFDSGGGGVFNGVTGASNVTNLFTLASGFSGSVEGNDIDKNSGTTLVDDNVTSADITTGRKFYFPFSPQFGTGDTTPSVSAAAPVFRTFNTGATTITNFDNGYPGQEFDIRFQDANTTIDIAGNANFIRADDVDTDLTPSNGTFYRVTNDRGTWVFHQG